MKEASVVEQIERLEDELQAVKWMVRPLGLSKPANRPPAVSIVTQTAGLLRGRLPTGRTYQRRLRREWEARLAREVR